MKGFYFYLGSIVEINDPGAVWIAADESGLVHTYTNKPVKYMDRIGSRWVVRPGEYKVHPVKCLHLLDKPLTRHYRDWQGSLARISSLPKVHDSFR